MYVRPKKSLGQHFLIDENIAKKIINSLTSESSNILEVGPGKGMLTKYLFENKKWDTRVIEIDRESIDYLQMFFPDNKNQIIQGDFLKTDLKEIFNKECTVIGNFPYNISSQILFKVIENREKVIEVVCMLQKEVAQRIASPPGSKSYGILSVFLQAFYDISYLFSVSEHVFNPPPKVKSAVIRLTRNDKKQLDCDESLFFKVVKTAFNQRRKTLRNALKVFNFTSDENINELLGKRAEQLSIADFVYLINSLTDL
ncbi:16S rRNA (adenine(1518)-N(6)/adenine(1519)-N(6))-dimethyltransferase RsmA [candidate division KSB1 bacterium]